MTVQIVEIAGQKIAMLPMDDYQRLVDIAEDKADVHASIEAERRAREGEEYIPSEILDRILAGENALRVWRNYRGLTQGVLGGQVGCTSEHLSMVETGRRQASAQLWRRLAAALSVDLDDIMPLEN
ncbi:helix-turn-helix transcriptional regulator [Sphingobium olei]|uniref:Helix-turn-helix transcriptional regulator n=1 Tax=Sphingobium olei TaxID=420955 RepID=A0ABW3NW46_9SPHN|nr:helix-turn-helix transcriptional regulator [Sphingobium sp.]